MIVQVPVTGGSAGVKATVSVEYQPQDPGIGTGWPVGALGVMQGRVQGLSDFTGTTTKQRQPAPVVQADTPTLTCLGTET